MPTFYNNSKIYKIVNSFDNLIYIGSSTNTLPKRFAQHKIAARKNPEQRVYAHLNEVGWENVRIVLVEAFSCANKDELRAREQHWMDTLHPSLNKNSAVETPCRHGKKRSRCVGCHGSSICSHNRQRNRCKDCVGRSQICEHGRKHSQCKDCGGSQICEHGRHRSACIECNNVLCECCGITVCKSRLQIHCQSLKHIRNFIAF